MNKTPQKPEQVEVRLRFTNIPRTLYANRFHVERENELYLVHFGLLAPSGLLVDHYCCVLTKFALAQNQGSLVDYLRRIGQPEDKAEKWQPPAYGEKSDVADIISMANREAMAETIFSVFSLIGTTRMKPSAGETLVESQPLVLVRSDADLQKQLLVALYEEE